jgi:ATP adenylyltransferase
MSERLWAPWRLEYVAGAGDAGGCIFCDKPALADDDALILHRGRHAFAVLNLYPYANGHLMVAPYRHLPMPGDLNADERAELWQLAGDGITALTAAMAPHGFNCGMNLGRVAGAGVEGHLHMHVVPRWNGDTNFMPVLADTRVMPEHLSRTLEKIRAAWPARSTPPAASSS